MTLHTAVHTNEAQTAVASHPNQRATSPRNWHALDPSLVTYLLEVEPSEGLTPSEVATRRLRYGPNNCEALESQRVTGFLVLLALSIVIGFLLAAAILNSAIRDNVEAFALILVVVVAAIVSFAHVLRAARALDAMRYATQASVRVIRKGGATMITAEELVPGDMIMLATGDPVPADARLVEVEEFRAQESALTGKNTAVEKLVSRAATDAPLAQRWSMVYLGSTVFSGRAVAAVVTTGIQTELGKKAACEN